MELGGTDDHFSLGGERALVEHGNEVGGLLDRAIAFPVASHKELSVGPRRRSDRVCTAAPWIVSGSHTTANFSGVAWIWWCTQGAKIASRWLFRNTLGTQREAVSVT